MSDVVGIEPCQAMWQVDFNNVFLCVDVRVIRGFNPVSLLQSNQAKKIKLCCSSDINKVNNNMSFSTPFYIHSQAS